MSGGLLLVHPFDAHAGSQRISHMLVTNLVRTGMSVRVKLGFGGRGFLSELPGVTPDIQMDHIPTRKLLYPFWTLFALVPTAWAAMHGRVIWAATVYAVPPALLAILLFPSRTVIHLHEATFPGLFRPLLRFAAWRGSELLCVSADQAGRIGIASRILPNPVPQPTRDRASRQNRLLFVGTTRPIKGFELFVAVCDRLQSIPLRKVAFLSDLTNCDHALVASARSAGIDIVFGEQSTEAIYQDGFLMLLCTNPHLWVETFSLVAAEAVTSLVPVGGAGVTVLSEVLGDALAFNDPSRDADMIAQTIADLYHDPDRHAGLRAACKARRSHFSETVFVDRILDVLKSRN